MSYQVSEKIQNKLDALTASEKVQKALKFMEEDQWTISLKKHNHGRNIIMKSKKSQLTGLSHPLEIMRFMEW